MIAIAIAVALALLQRATPAPSDAEVRAAEARALAFLLAAQNSDGSFGSARNASFNDLWSNPEVHKAWTVGTTGLACMALLGAGKEAEPALRRGVDALVAKSDLKRVSEWDLDDVWGYIYGLQALSRALADPRFATGALRAAIEKAARAYEEKLARYRACGWGYYASDAAAWLPNWSTSFTTAAAVLALVDAKAAGIAVPDAVIEPGLKAIERCRLPNGSFTYSLEAIPSPGHMEGIDNVKSAIGRNQACNFALLKAGREVSVDERTRGLDAFFEHHRFLELGRRRPIPHESYYAVAGYFYYFGHYYAAEVIASLPAEKRGPYAAKLLRLVLDTQEKDGSMTDYVMHDYPRPYGTAYGFLVMQLCSPARG